MLENKTKEQVAVITCCIKYKSINKINNVSSGFSVRLYWPSGAMTEKVKPKRKRRHRKRPKASISNIVTDVTTSPVPASELNGHSDVTPNKAQSNKDAHDSKPQTPVASPSVPPREASPTIHETFTSVTGSDSESEVDLLSCDNIS